VTSPDRKALDVGSLPGPKVRDVTEIVPQLLKSTDYCLLC